MSFAIKQDTFGQKCRDVSGKIFYGTLHWGGLAVVVYCGWNILAEVANEIRDWWHGGEREFASLWWIVGIAAGGLTSVWGESGLQNIRAALSEREAARRSEWNDFKRKQIEENRRYDRLEFADERARKRVANSDNPNWKEHRIPEELWEGCTIRSERLREWGFLLGDNWNDFGECEEAD